MAPLPDIDPIEFLVGRKFPPRTLAVPPSAEETGQKSSPPLSAEEGALLQKQQEDYRAVLWAMTMNEVDALFETEWEKSKNELMARAENGESERFFQPEADADFDHWSKAANWTFDEAVALSFGKAPEVVNSDSIREFRNVSPFVRRYFRVLDLANRAARMLNLFDPVKPIDFIKWADRNEIEFPAALERKVVARLGSPIDWKKKYEKLEADLAKYTPLFIEKVDEQNELIASYESQIDALTSKLEGVVADAAAASTLPAAEKPQSPRERMGMLKVIYAMAVGGYGFDPTAKRSKLVPDIAADLALQGLSVSDDTIRRYINEACDNLPEWQEETR